MDTDSTTASAGVHHLKKDKILVIMGATGCGKTKVSIDLATRFHSKIINSDKMQVYKGLDIITNKIPIQDRLGVPHHLLGEYGPDDDELTLSEFWFVDGLAISGIVSRERLPIVVGGSNYLIHALVVDRYFKKYPPGSGCGRGIGGDWDQAQRGIYEECVREIKENTCQLAKRKIGKILRLKGAGWDLQRVDATESFREVMLVRTSDEDGHKRKTKKGKKKKRWAAAWGREREENELGQVFSRATRNSVLPE